MDKLDLEKRLNTERQPEQKMPTSYSQHSYQSAELDAISEKSIGEMVCPTDGNHSNWKPQNVMAVHKSCHHYIHMSKRET